MLIPHIKQSLRFCRVLQLQQPAFQWNLLRFSSSKTHYEILGVDKNVTPKDLKTAYLKLCKKYHPDSNPSKEAQEMFVLVNKAYDVLSKAESREQYDQWLKGPKRKDFFSEAANETKTAGKKSPFPDTSQDYYLHPTFYKEGSKLRQEAESVWNYHLKMEQGRQNMKEMMSIKPGEGKEIAKTVAVIVLVGIAISLLFSLFFKPSRETRPLPEREEYAKNLEKRMKLAEEALAKKDK
ncbi:chaperone protein DnaJ-like [Dreissena polymorpha]|uniref:J domain-containing protein n=1 Tax=Dreissena polymorpha TaxID=45954 RepID=A0A9D4R3Y9_DREPO|nr:chaperone protein DnaJ-like [Dreissena polymorpha]KAH3853318.1 hypothetical protein DPMN_095840 [Dreissena polymorpha]